MREDQAAVFESLRPRLLRACRGYLGERHGEAADIVQDARMLAGPRLDAAAPLNVNAARLSQVCLQLCGARLRSREGVVRCLEPELERLSQALEPAAGLEAQKQRSVALLREAIKPLSLQGRQILQLRNVKGLSYAQIGATLDLTWTAVAQRLGDARDEMRALLPQAPAPAPSPLLAGPWGPPC